MAVRRARTDTIITCAWNTKSASRSVGPYQVVEGQCERNSYAQKGPDRAAGALRGLVGEEERRRRGGKSRGSFGCSYSSTFLTRCALEMRSTTPWLWVGLRCAYFAAIWMVLWPAAT